MNLPPLASPASFSMGFHCRKLLLQQHEEYPIPCGGGGGAAPSPSPIIQPSLARNIPFFPLHHDKLPLHLRPLVIFVVVGTLATIISICIISILRIRRERAHNNHIRGNAPVLFYVNGNSPVSASDHDDDDDEGPTTIEHPIWFIRTVGLNQSVIDSVTAFTYRKDEGLIDGTECSVCLGEFQEQERLRLLPKCSHAFHVPCIDMWLSSHQNCPLCRARVVHDAGTGSNEVSVTVPDHSNSNVSGENQSETVQMDNFDGGGEESESSASIVEGEEEGLQNTRSSVSMDSSSVSVVFHDAVVDLDSDEESSDTQLARSMRVKIDDKQGVSGVSATISKLASIRGALQKMPISVSLRSTFSSINNCRSVSSRHSRSLSFNLPM